MGYKVWLCVLAVLAVQFARVVTLFAMSLAWYIQTIISAVGSAMRGGLMMSRSLMKLAYKNGWKFVPQDDKDTNIDEFASYTFAAVGFWFQFQLNFAVPFPFNILLFPFA